MENKGCSRTVYLLVDKMYSNLGARWGSYLFVIKLHCETWWLLIIVFISEVILFNTIWFEKTAVNQHSRIIIAKAECTARSGDTCQKVGYWTWNKHKANRQKCSSEKKDVKQNIDKLFHNSICKEIFPSVILDHLFLYLLAPKISASPLYIPF